MSQAILNKPISTGAIHSLYSKDGKWYHHLTDFPGVLFDVNGFVVFKSKSDYSNSPYLQHGKHLNVPDRISSIPGYQKFTTEEKMKIATLL
jgi:hypothetical protein